MVLNLYYFRIKKNHKNISYSYMIKYIRKISASSTLVCCEIIRERKMQGFDHPSSVSVLGRSLRLNQAVNAGNAQPLSKHSC